MERVQRRVFKRGWFKIVDPARKVGGEPGSPDDPVEHVVRAWDLAATEVKPGRDPDWSAGVKIGKTKTGRYVVLDVTRFRATPLFVQTHVRRAAERDGQRVTIALEEEAGSSGKIVVDHFTREVLPGFAFRGIRSTGSKKERAAPLSSMAEAGNVALMKGPWNNEFLDELSAFPGGSHDDQVDAASLAFSQLNVLRDFDMWVLGEHLDYKGTRCPTRARNAISSTYAPTPRAGHARFRVGDR